MLCRLLSAVQPGQLQAALCGEDQWGYTPLHRAVQQGSAEAVGLLLSAANGKSALSICDGDGNSPLRTAAFYGHAAVVAQLLRASPPAADFINVRDKNGFTALMAAAQNGHKLVVEELLREASCRAEIQSHRGATALTLAQAAGHQEVVKLLPAAAEVRSQDFSASQGQSIVNLNDLSNTTLTTLWLDTKY